MLGIPWDLCHSPQATLAFLCWPPVTTPGGRNSRGMRFPQTWLGDVGAACRPLFPPAAFPRVQHPLLDDRIASVSYQWLKSQKA